MVQEINKIYNINNNNIVTILNNLDTYLIKDYTS